MIRVGKLSPETLKKIIFSNLGTIDPRVIIGPQVGEDAAVIDFGDRFLITHADPITGAIENIGWLSVNIIANDIATRGARPRWILTVMLLPQSIELSQIKQIMEQINEAAKSLGIAVVGGHTEITLDIDRPILITTAFGETNDKIVINTNGAKVGDTIIVTKGAAIEGTAILSTEMADSLKGKVDEETIRKAQGFVRMISVVKEAMIATEVGGVHAMHDVTEGGIATGLQEVAWASKVGVRVDEKKIPVFEETKKICEALGIDPLKTIGSGMLIIVADTTKAETIVEALKKVGIQGKIIGEVVKKDEGAHILRNDGSKLDLLRPLEEELWKHLRFK